MRPAGAHQRAASPLNGGRVNHDHGDAVLGPVVGELRCTGVFHTGELTSYCRRFGSLRGGRDTSHYPVARADGDPMIIGFLRKAEARYAMVVNRNPGAPAKMRIELHPGYRAFEISKADGRRGRPLAGTLALALQPGDGRLFEFEPGGAP